VQGEIGMLTKKKNAIRRVAALLLCLSAISTAQATVVVTVSGNTANAAISLGSYSAQVTIVFDSPINLTADNLNVTAQVVNPLDLAVIARLPLGVSIDPAFPVMITVEPVNNLWMFLSGFESPETTAGNLLFLNNYQFEVHTSNLTYVPAGPYRLFKAPLTGNFDDVTDGVFSGSVRARGRGGAFSQFLVVSDSRMPLLVATGKIVALNLRILAATLSDLLRGDLVGLLAQVNTALIALDFATAILHLDALTAEIEAHAGIDIANIWRADRDLINDAGELESLTASLRFTLVRLQGGP
jgi:hypothetical protein